MVILKRKIKKKQDSDSNLVGVFIPTRLATYLSLYCLATGKTKSSIFKTLISDWQEEQEKTNNFDELVYRIAIRSYNIWKNPNGKRDNFATFKSQLRNELEFKGLGVYVNRIISIISDEKNKEGE